MIGNYQRPSIESHVNSVLAGDFEGGAHIDQLHLADIAQKLTLKSKKTAIFITITSAKRKVYKSHYCALSQELLAVAESKNLMQNNYVFSLRFTLKPMFYYHNAASPGNEDYSDFATIINHKQDVAFPDNFEAFIDELDQHCPPELILSEGILDVGSQEYPAGHALNLDNYVNGHPYSVACRALAEAEDCGIYYHRYIRIDL